MTETKKHWLFEKIHVQFEFDSTTKCPQNCESCKKNITWWNTL